VSLVFAHAAEEETEVALADDEGHQPDAQGVEVDRVESDFVVAGGRYLGLLVLEEQVEHQSEAGAIALDFFLDFLGFPGLVVDLLAAGQFLKDYLFLLEHLDLQLSLETFLLDFLVGFRLHGMFPAEPHRPLLLLDLLLLLLEVLLDILLVLLVLLSLEFELDFLLLLHFFAFDLQLADGLRVLQLTLFHESPFLVSSLLLFELELFPCLLALFPLLLVVFGSVQFEGLRSGPLSLLLLMLVYSELQCFRLLFANEFVLDAGFALVANTLPAGLHRVEGVVQPVADLFREDSVFGIGACDPQFDAEAEGNELMEFHFGGGGFLLEVRQVGRLLGQEVSVVVVFELILYLLEERRTGQTLFLHSSEGLEESESETIIEYLIEHFDNIGSALLEAFLERGDRVVVLVLGLSHLLVALGQGVLGVVAQSAVELPDDVRFLEVHLVGRVEQVDGAAPAGSHPADLFDHEHHLPAGRVLGVFLLVAQEAELQEVLLEAQVGEVSRVVPAPLRLVHPPHQRQNLLLAQQLEVVVLEEFDDVRPADFLFWVLVFGCALDAKGGILEEEKAPEFAVLLHDCQGVLDVGGFLVELQIQQLQLGQPVVPIQRLHRVEILQNFVVDIQLSGLAVLDDPLFVDHTQVEVLLLLGHLSLLLLQQTPLLLLLPPLLYQLQLLADRTDAVRPLVLLGLHA
jgi:hypothetical protein